MMSLATDYGPFGPIVAASGSIVAMGIAVSLGFKGRAKWEPVEQDVPKGPAKVASLVASLSIVMIWAELNSPSDKPILVRIVVDCMAAVILSLLAYGLLKGFTYKVIKKKKQPNPSNETEEQLVIGGLWLRRAASEHLNQVSENGVGEIRTIQRMFAESEYDKDVLWSHLSQSLASMLFTIGYMGLVVFGTVALGAGAVLTSVVMKK